MKNKTITILLITLSQLTINLFAQDYAKDTWIKSISINGGIQASSNSWEYYHPFYGEAGLDRIASETGSFKLKSFYSCNFELSKGYFGISAGAGIFPAEIKVDKTEELFTINSIFAELEALFYPFGINNRKITPTLSLGIGGAKSSGSIDTSALFYSLGASLNSFFTKRVGASLSINNRYYTFDEIPLDQNITGDIKFNNYSLKIGLIYAFN